jgi:hypothetical protein
LGHADVAVLVVAISQDSAADYPAVVIFIHCRVARGRGKGPGVPRRKASGVLGVAAARLLLCILVAAMALCGGEARILCALGVRSSIFVLSHVMARNVPGTAAMKTL